MGDAQGRGGSERRRSRVEERPVKHCVVGPEPTIKEQGWLTRGILKKCVNGQAVYPLSEQHGLKVQERRYTAYGKEKH